MDSNQKTIKEKNGNANMEKYSQFHFVYILIQRESARQQNGWEERSNKMKWTNVKEVKDKIHKKVYWTQW